MPKTKKPVDKHEWRRPRYSRAHGPAALSKLLQVQHARMVLGGWRFVHHTQKLPDWASGEVEHQWEVFDAYGTCVTTREDLEEAIIYAYPLFLSRHIEQPERV